MIVVEEVLQALFSQITEWFFLDDEANRIDVRKPQYHFGDVKEANRFITDKNTDCYPLIYQILGEETHLKGYVTTNLQLVLCTQNKNIEQYNDVRWKISYEKVLLVLLERVQACLEQSNVIHSEFNYTIRKEPNYSETPSKERNAFVDIVDAIVVNVDVVIRPKGCVNKNIKFKNV